MKIFDKGNDLKLSQEIFITLFFQKFIFGVLTQNKPVCRYGSLDSLTKTQPVGLQDKLQMYRLLQKMGSL
jgi:hypothetical protein